MSGWFPDPSGRFAQRWYDGHSWTDRVVGANGSVVGDTVPADQEPWAPPLAQRVGPVGAPLPPPSQPAPPHRPAPPPHGAPVTTGSGVPGLLLGIGLVGVILSLLGLVALPWAERGPRVTEITGNLWESGVDPGDAGVLLWTFFAFGGYVTLLVVLVAVVVAAVPLGGRAGHGQRIVASVLAGLAALYQTAVVADLFAGPADPGIGAWVGVAGYFVVIVAMIVGGTLRRGAAR